MPDSTRYKVLKNSDSEDDFELDHRQLRSRGQLPSNLPSSMRERNSTTTAFSQQNNNSPKSSNNKLQNNTHYLEYRDIIISATFKNLKLNHFTLFYFETCAVDYRP